MSYISADNISFLQIACNSAAQTAIVSALAVADSTFSTDLQPGKALSTEPAPVFGGAPVISWDTYKGSMRLQFLTNTPHLVVPRYLSTAGIHVVAEGGNTFSIKFDEFEGDGSPQCDFELTAMGPVAGGGATTRMKVILLPKPTPPDKPVKSPTPFDPDRPFKTLGG